MLAKRCSSAADPFSRYPAAEEWCFEPQVHLVSSRVDTRIQVLSSSRLSPSSLVDLTVCRRLFVRYDSMYYHVFVFTIVANGLSLLTAWSLSSFRLVIVCGFRCLPVR